MSIALGEYKCRCGARIIVDRTPQGKLITKHEIPLCAPYLKLLAEGGAKEEEGVEYIEEGAMRGYKVPRGNA